MTEVLIIPQGWQCPACRTIHAPHHQLCECQTVTIIDITTEGPIATTTPLLVNS